MQLTVLGRYGPYAAKGGATSAYLVRSANSAVMLDFGSGALGRLQNFISLGDLNAAVLSHLHYDHISDLFALSYYYAAAGKRLKVISPDCPNEQYALLNGLNAYDLCTPQNGIKIGELQFGFKRMVHPVPSYAVKVECGGRKLCYSGDTSYCPELLEFAADAHLLVLDCGKREGTCAPHLSLAEAEQIARELKIKTVASHLNPELGYVTRCGFLSIAEEMKTYEV